ncbi:SlyX family protein [Mariprofundus erugo]|uniref:Protein SlyX homolog n=1 Tax=Mariprofundus erugo TaxID=2528639 RepID=A0A5R9GLG1_9PROT|nr:SlyX family protein [Mariprofundus erugo]TLS66960.1 SlyX family protein [Mariprofundus erugo]TLS77339.1 SlyX family protein [Mariprofundus erugo]
MENRIIELESRLTYQDHTISELNEVVIRQQKQIDRLEAVVEQLRAHLKQHGSSGLARPEEEVPPPHY